MFVTNMFVYAGVMTSRRERPAKPALSRAGIVDATIRIMRAEGLERATMRRVAQELDTGAASLYVYVANTTELHAAVLDALLGTIPEPTGADWRARMHGLLGAYASVLFENPGLARSAVVLRPTGPEALRLYDRVLGLLLDGGVPVDRAAWGVDLLLQYVTSSAAEHSAPTPSAGPHVAPGPVDDLDGLALALRGADPGAAPNVAAHADAILGGTPAERTAWAVDSILSGVARTPIPTPTDRSASASARASAAAPAPATATTTEESA